MPRKPTVWTLVVTLLVTGCAHNPFDFYKHSIAEYKPGDRPETTTAPYQGSYALYRFDPAPLTTPAELSPRSGSDETPKPLPPLELPPGQRFMPDCGAGELYVRLLSDSDKIGFEKSDDGKLIAIAGSERIPVDDGHYCWYVTTEKERHGFEPVCHETCKNGVTVVACALWPVGIAIQVPFAAVLGAGFLGVYLYEVSLGTTRGCGRTT